MPQPSAAGHSSRAWRSTWCAPSPIPRSWPTYVATGDLLPRSNYDLCRHIKEYVVAEGPTGEVIGCGSLKVYSQELAELAGLAVRQDWQRAGVGGALLVALIAEARAQGLAEVLAPTRKPPFL